MADIIIPRSVGLMADDDWRSLQHDAEGLFTPGTAIKEQDLFAGRAEQINKLAQRIRMAGSHAVIYGERGVGKSSLVNIFRYIADAGPRKVQYIRIAANANDDFSSLMMKIFKRMSNPEKGNDARLSDSYEGKSITPDDVLIEMENFAASTTPIIVIDEFDRLADSKANMLVSDTIKLLSDEGANVTFFVVGISDAVGTLLMGHASIGRALAEIEMPRMSDEEIIDIIITRLKRVAIGISAEALWDCVFICKGLPHYAHLLGLHAMQAMCERRVLRIDQADVRSATTRALDEANQSIKKGFDTAVYSERPDNIFKEVIFACALSTKDALGRFNARSVAACLSDITGEHYDVPAFSYHLNEFCAASRGQVLQKIGQRRQFRYRFSEALMEPYVLMEGIERGLLSDAVVKKYKPKRQADLFSI